METASTSTSTSTSTTIRNLDGKRLRAIVAAARCTASTDRFRPALCAIHVEVDVDARRMTLTSTDSYILGRVDVDLDALIIDGNGGAVGQNVDALLDARDLDAVLAGFRMTGKGWHAVDLDLDQNGASITYRHGPDTARFARLDAVPGMFPNLATVITPEWHAEPVEVERAGFMPALSSTKLATLCKAASKLDAAHVTLYPSTGDGGTLRPVTLHASTVEGTRYRALIMPIRRK